MFLFVLFSSLKFQYFLCVSENKQEVAAYLSVFEASDRNAAIHSRMQTSVEDGYLNAYKVCLLKIYFNIKHVLAQNTNYECISKLGQMVFVCFNMPLFPQFNLNFQLYGV